MSVRERKHGDRCGIGPGDGEHMLCGLAFDAYESGDEAVPVIQAQNGETITCPHCRRALSEVRAWYRGFCFVG